jgi:hypothetical protein
MNDRAVKRCKPDRARCLSALVRVACVLALAGCAAGKPAALPEADGPDVGLIEIANRSPEYLLAIGVFDNGEECRGLKYVTELEKFKTKSFKADHRQTLSLWVTYSSQIRTGFKSCGAIYSLPFVQGDLRVTVEATDAMKQCRVGLSASTDRKTWAEIPGSRKRVGSMSIQADDAWCEKE